MKDILNLYLEKSSCNMENCPYGFDVECAECIEKMVAEHDKQIREKAKEEIKSILNAFYLESSEFIEYPEDDIACSTVMQCIAKIDDMKGESK